MAATHGGANPVEGAVLNMLREVNQQLGLKLNDTQLMNYYFNLKKVYQSRGEDIVVTGGNGREVSQAFLTDFVSYARTGDNPYAGGGQGSGTVPPSEIPNFSTGDEAAGGLTKRQKRENRLNTKASWNQLLVSFGLDPNDKNLQQLVQQATFNRYNDARFLEYLRKTPEYRDRFRGIFDENGLLRMTESQYLALDKQYESILARAGLNYTDNMRGFLFKNDVSAAEASARASGIKMLMQNPTLFEQFGKELVRTGTASPGEITKKNLLKFAMGELSNKEWTNLWQDAAARNAAVESGLRITRNNDRYAAISRQRILQIADKGYSPEALAQGFQSVADQFLSTMPLSEAKRFGLKKEDILQATFGGPKAAQARQKIKRVLETNEAFFGERANQQVYTTEQGGVNVLGGTDDRVNPRSGG